jgi:hypothetical protein
MKKERRGYVVLVLLSVFLSVATYAAGVRKQTTDEHKFCDIVTFSLSVPAPKPADPKAHPSRQRAYEGYQKVVRLGQSLGCHIPR